MTPTMRRGTQPDSDRHERGQTKRQNRLIRPGSRAPDRTYGYLKSEDWICLSSIRYSRVDESSGSSPLTYGLRGASGHHRRLSSHATSATTLNGIPSGLVTFETWGHGVTPPPSPGRFQMSTKPFLLIASALAVVGGLWLTRSDQPTAQPPAVQSPFQSSSSASNLDEVDRLIGEFTTRYAEFGGVTNGTTLGRLYLIRGRITGPGRRLRRRQRGHGIDAGRGIAEHRHQALPWLRRERAPSVRRGQHAGQRDPRG